MAKKKEQVEVLEAETIVIESACSDTDDAAEKFITRKLAVINKMSDSAKAQRLAARLLMNNRKGQ